MDRQTRGKEAETHAKGWLTQQGLTFVQQNYHSRYGEIDLIFTHKDVLIFIEVRRRSNQRFGGAAASVTRHKQQKILTCAEHFLVKHPAFQHYNCRFDVIAYEASPESGPPLWYKDAFRA